MKTTTRTKHTIAVALPLAALALFLGLQNSGHFQAQERRQNAVDGVNSESASSEEEEALSDSVSVTSYSGPMSGLPFAASSFGFAQSETTAWVLGGNQGNTHSYRLEDLNNTLYKIDLKNGKASEIPGGIPMLSPALVVDQGLLYRIGGATVVKKGEARQLTSIATVARRDAGSGEWQTLPDLPQARSSHSAAMLDGKLYVVGGWNLQKGMHGEFSSTMLTCNLDAETPEWQSLDVSFQLRGHAMQALRGKLYLLGGMTAHGALSNALKVYDPATGSWSEGPELPEPAFGGSLAVSGSDLYSSGMSGGIYQLNSKGNAWIPISKLLSPRYFGALAVSGDRLGYVGGTARGSRPASIEWLERNGDDMRSTRVVSIETHWPGQSKNRQAVFIQGSNLFVCGGNKELGQHAFAQENFLKEAWKVDLGSLEATRIADLPFNRQSMAAHVIPTHVIHGGEAQRRDAGIPLLFSGFGHDGETTRSFNEMVSYDVAANKWHSVGSTPTTLTQFCSCEKDGKLFVFGGMNFVKSRERQFQLQDKSVSLDLTQLAEGGKLKWNQDATKPLLNARRAIGGARIGNHYYVIGGMGDRFSQVNDCEVYDFTTDSWKLIPSPSKYRISPKVVALNDKLYVIGGSGFDGRSFIPEESVEVYDPVTREWRVLLEKLPFSPRHAQALVWGDVILLVSTLNEENKLKLALIQP